MSRLVLVEGIPGSGKSTTAERLGQILAAGGARVTTYLEGEPQPTDLAWQWWLPGQEFEQLCRRYPEAAAELRRCAWSGPAGTAIAYTKLDRAAFRRPGGTAPEGSARDAGLVLDRLHEELGEREPFNGRITPEAFVALNVRRWTEFARAELDRPGFVIMETALLQNPIGELWLYAQWPPARIAVAINELLAPVTPLEPLLVLLRTPGVAATVAAAAAERVDEQGNPWWLSAANAYVAQSPWGVARGVGMRAGASAPLVDYLQARVELEDFILPELRVRWRTLASPAGSAHPWTQLEDQLQAVGTELLRAGVAPY